ncbi:hypothetical protein NA217_20505 [Salmonella sp. NW859]|nr:hypothetical protein [Salmonella enterica]HBJ3133190.1 hypothetical protein [Salmonella enterica subsp. enterica serovar Anatum]EHV3472839.1 hypothetical protein [Salmonella enterica]ELY2953339.1 hypothetical protein [Salmonella enterica]ELY3431700.1 hypothetical protein [Salmonella enterica]EME5107055.1 hypothetical protein [Salmonella enterica]
MIPYIILSLAIGLSRGFITHRRLVKQQLEAKSMRIDKRIYLHKAEEQK